MEKKSICEIVREAQKLYTTGTVKRGKYVNWSMYDTVEKIVAYYNSVHTKGSTDSLGREKPFFNITTAATNIWYRATDVDRKDMTITPTKDTSVLQAFLATVFLQEWMRKTNFGKFLNQWGRTLAKFGSAVCKFVEKDGELIPVVVPWRNIICDPSDWEALPVIERFYATPSQLRKNKVYDQEVVEQLIQSLTTRKNKDETTQDLLSNFIEVFEISGELPRALMLKKPEEKDWKEFVQQKHVVTFEKTDTENEYEDYKLYSKVESKSQYILTHLIEEEDRVLGMGAIETLFESQWMINHSVKNMKDTLDLASMLLLQTADGNFVNRNVLNDMVTGQIMVHAQNQQITKVDNSKPDITALQNFIHQWQVLGQEQSSTPESMRGITPPSGTPYSSVAMLTGQASSLFEIMVENKGLYLEEMLRNYIIPHIKKKMNNRDTVVATLQDHQIKQVDAKYVPAQARKQYIETAKKDLLFGGQIAQPFDQVGEESAVKEALGIMNKQYPFIPNAKTWKEELKDTEWEFDINISGEAMDKGVMLQTLTNLFQTIVSVTKNPKNAEAILNKILNITGVVSPLELVSEEVVSQGGAMQSPQGGVPTTQPLQALNTPR